jgi:hypothetical protein
MPVNEKILFKSFQYLFSPKSRIYAIFRRQCCAKITLFFWGKNIGFEGGGGGINIRFRPKDRPLPTGGEAPAKFVDDLPNGKAVDLALCSKMI